ncbi:hypothetical protein BDR07DRAFT_1317385 [Suillus spraguei]|nr:hypothetical protein BDR07DRAFT_1317385 [Suillus spraguei]
MLIARAHTSQIIHFYSYKPSEQHNWLDEEASQRYNQSNVAIRPQDSTELQFGLLPPSHDQLHDAMCVMFGGHAPKPSRETVGQMRPVLVTKSIVNSLTLCLRVTPGVSNVELRTEIYEILVA